MRLRRRLIRLWGLQHPPVASSTLPLLLCLFWLMGIGDHLALVPGLLLKPLHAYRLVTYCLCHEDATWLLFNVMLFPLLGWRQELHLGTLRYLHASLLGATVSALLYLLLAGLWDAQPATSVGGYAPVHLAMLGHHQRQQKQGGVSGAIPAALAAGVLLGVSRILFPSSPFLLHASGLLTCLACILLLLLSLHWHRWSWLSWLGGIFLDKLGTLSDCAGIFSRLELSERSLEWWHNGIVCRSLAGVSFLPFVKPPATGLLPTTDPAARTERIPSAVELQSQPVFPRVFPTQPPPPPSLPYWGEEKLEQESGLPYMSVFPSPFSGPSGASNIPFSALHESLMEEEMLQAGIQASLQDAADGKVKLSKSSVSSLRLQQLQKMGFSTEQAVVALAATGHVEGAVSLLTGGHVGDSAVVTSEGQLAHGKPTGPHQ